MSRQYFWPIFPEEKDCTFLKSTKKFIWSILDVHIDDLKSNILQLKCTNLSFDFMGPLPL